MTQSQEYELHVLNELIVATMDRAKGYSEAAARAEPSLALTFAQRAREHLEAAEQLKHQVVALHGEPATPTSIIGAAYSAYTRQIECVDDESTKQCFEKALKDIRISDLVRTVIYTARDRIDDEPCLQMTPAQ